ncbi:hypothetical protein F4859DRAFT_407085 [Xylaria cf. heliscus]|nr:hypothetical protein F4859DRAFT_407085 [Xylaria cf. heliscus]
MTITHELGCINWLGMRNGRAFLIFVLAGSLGVTAQRCLHKGEVLDLPIVLDFHCWAYIYPRQAWRSLFLRRKSLHYKHIHIDDTASPREL